MSKHYDWRLSSEIISGGYDGEETGVIPPDTGWRSTDVMTGSSSAEYYFRDSDLGQNANSSRVVVSITETWEASIDDENYLTVKLKTTLNSIRRDDLRGNVGSQTVPRSMKARREDGGPVIWSIASDPINTAHTLLGSPIVLDEYTFTLPPGESLSRGSIFFRNNTYGHDDDPVPSIYVDLMWLGTEFRNPLPRDYRPGQRKINGIWQSHNRDGGASDRIGFGTMRTLAGGVGTGNPPSRKTSDTWYNQRKIGENA